MTNIENQEESRSSRTTTEVPSWFAPVSVGAGLVFLVAVLAAAVFIPHPSAFQVFVFRVVMALAAASFGATIPGFLNVDMPLWEKGAIAAGGALALFVIVFQLNPPSLTSSGEGPPHASRHIELIRKAQPGLDLPDCKSSNADLEGFVFDGSILSGCDFRESALSHVRFKDANVSGSDFSNSEAYGANFEDAGAVGTDFSEAILVGAIFRGADLSYAKLWGARLIDADFREADLGHAKLAGSDISGADFREALHLTQEQINTAFYDPGFDKPLRLPNDLTPPPPHMERDYLVGIDAD